MSEANPELKHFLTRLEEENEPELKVKMLVDFMQEALAQGGSPHFKLFWEARRRALELFREVKNPQSRTQLWEKYSELSKEARRLKDLLDEESAFNVEQIELAIQALEKDCAASKEQAERLSPLDLSKLSHYVDEDLNFFEPKQRELNLLNAHAARINALRKELIRIDMRIRQKNKFFQRLSEVGDLIFPRRKELINDLSDRFSVLVTQFKERHFSHAIRDSHFFLRDEIKGLQGAAKLFTLSAQTFKSTRLLLSECWDLLKAEEKDLKKHRQEQKEIFKTNCHELTISLKEIADKFSSQEMDVGHAEKALSEFNHSMQDKELGRDEVRFLKEELSKVKDLVFAEARKVEEARIKEAQEKELERQAKFIEAQNNIKAFIEAAATMEGEAVEAKRDELIQEIHLLPLPKREKLELEKLFRPLKDLLVEKKEAELLKLPENDRQALAQLQEVLKERKARKQEQKTLVDELRTKAGSSGLDMIQALNLSEQLSEEKEKLEHLTTGIKELERKIADYKKRSE